MRVLLRVAFTLLTAIPVCLALALFLALEGVMTFDLSQNGRE